MKDQFETQKDFEQRIKQEIKSFQEAESLKFKDTFVIESAFCSDDCNYNADERIITI